MRYFNMGYSHIRSVHCYTDLCKTLKDAVLRGNHSLVKRLTEEKADSISSDIY